MSISSEYENIPLGQIPNEILLQVLEERFEDGFIFAALVDEQNHEPDFLYNYRGSRGIVFSLLKSLDYSITRDFIVEDTDEENDEEDLEE